MKKLIAAVFICLISMIAYAQDAGTADTTAAESEPAAPAPKPEIKPEVVPETKPVVPETKPAPVVQEPVKQVQPVQNSGSDEARLLAAIDSNPKNWDYYNRLINMYTSQNRGKDRLKIALKAIQNIGGNAYLYTIVGDENKGLGDFNKALISYQFALRLTSSDHLTYNRIGLVLLKMSNFNQAEAAFRAAIFYSASGGNNFTRSIYYNNLAVAYEAIHDLKNAYKFFQTAIKLYPAYTTAVDNFNRVSSNLKASGISPN